MQPETGKKWRKPTAAELRLNKEGTEENIRIRTAQLHYRMDCLKKKDKLLREANEGVEKANANLAAVKDLIDTGPEIIENLAYGIECLKKTLRRNEMTPKIAKLAKLRARIELLEVELLE